MKRLLIYALLLVTTIFFAACTNDPPVEVTATQVLSVNGTMSITRDGTLSLSGEQKILSPISGNVVATFFERGQEVSEGQPLFKIGRQQDEAELFRAKAALGEAMANLAKARVELAQAQAQLRRNEISAREVDDKKFALDECQAALDECQAAVQKLEDDSASGMIYAPSNGHIGVMTTPLGATVTANETILAQIGNTDPIAIRLEVSAEERQFLAASDALKITLTLDDGSTYPRAGKLNFPEASEVAVTFDNPIERLLLGETVHVVFDGVNVPETLLVPEKAIQLRGGDNYVFVVDSNKKAALKKISLGGKLGNFFVVNDGLKAGDSVVVEGLTNLRDGTPVEFRDEGLGTRN